MKKKWVKGYVNNCAKYHINKILRPKRKAPVEIMTTTRHLLEKQAKHIDRNLFLLTAPLSLFITFR
jgi:hypothetical protein